MTDQVRLLLGGYATGTLTPEENEALFRAALEDQELFNALADDEALRKYLSDPVFRQDLLKATAPPRASKTLRWMAVCGAAAAALAFAVLWVARPTETIHVEMAVSRPPLALPPASSVATPPLAGAQANSLKQEADRPQTKTPVEARNAQVEPPPQPLASRDVSSVAALASPPAQEPRKLKIAVLDFESGPTRPGAGPSVSDLISDKLAADGVFTVIGRDQVRAAMRDALANPPNQTTASEIGRQLGADAVVVGQVGVVNGAAPSPMFAPKAGSRTASPANAPVSARLIDSATGQSLRNAVAPNSADLNSAAQQISTALERTVHARITDVNAAILTIDAGSNSGLKLGDRLTVLHDTAPIGEIVITTTEPAFSVGRFTGTKAAQIGDLAITPKN